MHLKEISATTFCAYNFIRNSKNTKNSSSSKNGAKDKDPQTTWRIIDELKKDSVHCRDS